MTSNTREIVTFQLGHYSNFVGTHWWNIQDSSFVYDPTKSRFPRELNHDALFREGVNLVRDVTYTPRLIALDLKGSLNTLKQEGVLYELEDGEGDLNWTGDVTLHKTQQAQKNAFLRDLEKEGEPEDLQHETSISEKENDDDEKPGGETSETDKKSLPSLSEVANQRIFGPTFYDLDNQVDVWSDYLRVHLHPKSVAVVEQYRHGWENEPFDVFGYGQEVYNHHETKQQLEDRVHFFIEECDNLQGMQFMVDTQDGFGGIASSMIEDLNDDYSNKSMVIYSVSPPSCHEDTIVKQCHRSVNSLLSYDQLLNNSSMLVPMSLSSKLWRQPGPARELNHIKYNSELPYHSSAILAATLDTMTIPYRLDGHNRMLMSHFTDSMTSSGRKVLSVQTALPIALGRGDYFMDYLQGLGDTPPWQSLTPGCANNTLPFHQSVVVRGIPSSHIRKTTNDPSLLGKSEGIKDMMQQYLNDVYCTKLNAVESILQPLMTKNPFPHIINRSYLYQGVKNIASTIDFEGVIQQASLEMNTAEASSSKYGGNYSENVNKEIDFKHSTSILSECEATEVPMMTALQCSTDVRNHIQGLVDVCKGFKIGKFHRFIENGLEEDMYKESLENLVKLSKCYGDTSDSDSDDSD